MPQFTDTTFKDFHYYWVKRKIDKNGPYSYNGDFRRNMKLAEDTIDGLVWRVWWTMMCRCYKINHMLYNDYGGKEILPISVNPRWHIFSQFLEDVKLLPNWERKLGNWDDYQLDKDHFGSNVYSVDTCVWLHRQENFLYADNIHPIIITFGDERYECLSIRHAARKIKINHSSLNRWLQKGFPKRRLCKRHEKYQDIKFEHVSKPDLVLRRGLDHGGLPY